MPTLHTINKSPFEKNSLDACARLALPGSSVLLLEDGVYAAVPGTAVEPKLRDLATKVKIHVLGPDLKARGLSADKVIEGVNVVDYGGFVDLVCEHSPVQAWL